MTHSGSNLSAVTQIRPRITHWQPPADLEAAERAAASFLTALGVDISSEATADTPRRMASAYAEMLAVPGFDMTTFPNDQNYDELVMVEAIPVRSLCEHHMLPFTGTAHIGYLPADRILGLSKFARVLEFYAKRPQLQERLTEQVADYFDSKLKPQGVMVVIEARHLCVEMRGVKKPGPVTVTSSIRGIFHQKPVREEFLDLLRRG